MHSDDKCVCLFVGPVPAYLLSAIIKDGKTASGGKLQYMGSLRHRLPIVCWHGSLGRYFVHRFSISQAIFPDPHDATAFLNYSLWPGSHQNKSISDQTLRHMLNKAFDHENLVLNKKLHLFRHSVTRIMESAGVDDAVRSHSFSFCDVKLFPLDC